jgi:hypothetical protein
MMNMFYRWKVQGSMENKMETWSQRIDRYLSEGRTVSGGCGPSKEMKSLNTAVQKTAGDMRQQASQIFGDASSVFTNLMGSLQSIVKGGPSQQGWSAAESNAVKSQIMDQAAINARNQKAAVGNAVASIGGGNTVTPSGLETAVNLQTNQAVEQAKSQQLEQATVADYEKGNENYFKAVSGEMQLPKVFDTSIAANKNTMDAQQEAIKSQQSMDTANNWWQPLVMGGIKAGESFLTGGLSNMGSGSGMGDFVKGGFENFGNKG